MKHSFKLAAVLTLALASTACTETVTGLAIVSTAVTGFFSTGTENKDYTKYADTCKAIVTDIVAYRTSRHTVISTALNSGSDFVKGGAMVMLAREDKDDMSLFSQCALKGPESFLQTVFRNTNVANLALALYQENRADSRAQRQLEVTKLLSLENMRHTESMTEMNNGLLTDLAGRPTDNFNAGAAAAKLPTAVPAATSVAPE
jgi:hypothetical protein